MFCNGTGITHIALSLLGSMGVRNGAGSLETSLTLPAGERRWLRPFVRYSVPPSLNPLVYRVVRSEKRLFGYSASRYLASVRAGDVAYLWPSSPRWMYDALKDRGASVVMERINCVRTTSRPILEEAYERIGRRAAHGMSDEAVRCELEKLSVADLVFSPAPCVTQSLLDAGVPEAKILRSSYGWDPTRVRSKTPVLPAFDGVTVAFVGYICVRKGAHLLLEAWAEAAREAGFRGRLVLMGNVEPAIAERCAEHLKRSDVTVLPFGDNVGGVLASADLFAFPTLEEGSPLVVYEAMAAGLPILTSAMGSGEVVRDVGAGRGVGEGWVLEPYDRGAWVSKLRELCANKAELGRVGAMARERAEHYVWSKVGERRGHMLLEAMAARSGLVGEASVVLQPA